MTNVWSALFRPRRIAVVGFTAQPDSLADQTFKQLQRGGFSGSLVAVGSADSQATHLGAKVWPATSEAHQPVDLAIIHQPVWKIKDTIIDCGYAGAKVAVIIPEISEEGALDQDWRSISLAAASRSNVRLIGPATIGFSRPRIGLNFHVHTQPRIGNIGLICQLSTPTNAIVDGLNSQGLGTSFVVVAGNEWDMTVADFLNAAASDTQTKVIGLCMSKINDLAAIMAAIRQVTAVKPLVILLSDPPIANRQQARLLDMSIRQSGAILTRSLEEYCHLLGWIDQNTNVEKPVGPLAIHLAQEVNFEDDARPGIHVVDFTSQPADRLVELASSTAHWRQHHRQPVIAVLNQDEQLDDTRQLLQSQGLAVCSAPQQASTLAHILNGNLNSLPKIKKTPLKSLTSLLKQTTLPTSQRIIPAPEARQIFEDLGLKMIPGQWMALGQLKSNSHIKLTWPVRITAVESLAGRVGATSASGPITSSLALRREITRLGPEISRLYIQTQPTDGFDVSLEVAADPDFGTLTTVSVPGINAISNPDYQVGVGPVTRQTAEQLLVQAGVDGLLEQWPDKAPRLREQLTALLQNCSAMMTYDTRIAKILIKPLLVSSDRLTALDAQITLSS